MLRQLEQRQLRRENDTAKKKAGEAEREPQEQVLESVEWAVDGRSMQIVVYDLEMRR